MAASRACPKLCYTRAMSGYTVLQDRELEAVRDPARDFALDVLVSLSERPKRLSSKYMYDDEGSDLFQRIMGVEEYYPTACEREILQEHGRSILATCGNEPLNLVDLGAGDGAKTMILLRALLESGIDFQFVPIDISEGAMQSLVTTVQAELPDVPIDGLVCEYADGLDWLATHQSGRRNLLLFLGSNIGNFDKPRARAFLRRLWTALKDDDYALVGFDLKKDIDVLLGAYNDREGVTAAFNLNLLERINRELGGSFDLERFRHYGTFDVFSGAMQSYLVSLVEQDVRIESLGRSFHFEAWEPIHTEYSYKYLDQDIEDLAVDCGFEVEAKYRDGRRYFVDALWRVRK